MNRLAIVMVAASASLTAGCAWKTIDAGCANVPNPVLLSRVDRIKGHQATATPLPAKIDVEVAEVVTVTNRREGDYQVTTVRTKRDGANKASFAVMAATQGKKDADVRLESASAGAYIQFPIFFLRSKTWVELEGSAGQGGGK